MSEITAETVRRTALLARLELSPDELERLVPELERILEAFRVLAGFRGGPPSASLAPGAARARDDEPGESLPAELALAGAPEREESFFAVPKTVGGER